MQLKARRPSSRTMKVKKPFIRERVAIFNCCIFLVAGGAAPSSSAAAASSRADAETKLDPLEGGTKQRKVRSCSSYCPNIMPNYDVNLVMSNRVINDTKIMR
jgi:hypothetical protein